MRAPLPVNNAVARTAQLLAVAVLPLVAGLSGADYRDPEALTAAFHVAMAVAAGLAAVGGAIAWLTIADDVLEPDVGAEPAEPAYHCGVAGPPLTIDVAPSAPAAEPAPAR